MSDCFEVTVNFEYLSFQVDEEHYDKPTEISVAGYDGKVKVRFHAYCVK